jgi:hypothetical protein
MDWNWAMRFFIHTCFALSGLLVAEAIKQYMDIKYKDNG